MKTSNYLPETSLKGGSKRPLTVIIPTLNEIAYLPGLLDALAAQTCLPDEVIVADAGSTDGTAEMARAHGARVIAGGMPAVGRNAGACSAVGNLFLFLDADVLPPPDFIARALEEFERKEFDVATCLITGLDENPLDRVLCTGTNLYFRVIQPFSPHAPGFCILSKRVTHEKMGGFDESLMISEDIDYARRAKQYGKFGFLTSTRIPVSMRRVGKEGLIGIGFKYAWCEMYALVGKPVREVPFKYEFAKYGSPQNSANRALINEGEMCRQWKKIIYPLQKYGSKIREQFIQ
jgi:glycosyltransferase involved in cell wall biosynthesis